MTERYFSKPYFNDVDFELMSDVNLSRLTRHLEPSVSVLRNELSEDGQHFYFEMLPREGVEGGLEETLTSFFELIDSLDDANRNLFEACRSKVIDVGFMSGEVGWLYESISPRLIGLMADWKIELRFSIYGINPTAK